MEYVIGVDLDNTIINFGGLIYRVGLKLGYANPSDKRSKKYIRDKIRSLPEGERKWQKLQPIVYGRLITEACVYTGVYRFFQLCRTNGIKVFIISHKTEYSKYDSARINLRVAALRFLEENKFFDKSRPFLPEKSVYFEDTRVDKIQRISSLNCTHFIDDLEETFNEKGFPSQAQKILFDPHGDYTDISGIRSFNDWKSITAYFFG
jgi:hypothetical protein